MCDGMMMMLVGVVVVMRAADALLQINPGPKYKPSQGEVWPRAQHEIKENRFYSFNPTLFHIEVTGVQCPVLLRAVERYRRVLGMERGGVGGSGGGGGAGQLGNKRTRRRRMRTKLAAQRGRNPLHQGILHRLHVNLTAPCEVYPHFNMDESYDLTVATISTLSSNSVWGAIRGLETFAQLLYYGEGNEMQVNATYINDWPRYQHRGLLVDTARHYLTPRLLKRMIDAMSINKMNVLHWHIVDDQSFPYVSEQYPKLSEKGAYHPSLVYTASDIQDIVQYARDRGVRVLPEFDVPGHTRSWGEAYPELLTECNDDPNKLGPMNPVHDSVYQLLQGLFKEIASHFPDDHVHIGGDEVDTSCWSSNLEVVQYMLNNNISQVKDLQGVFMKRVLPLVAKRLTPIVWNEVFRNVQPLNKDVVVQFWTSPVVDEVTEILRAGHNVIMSSFWYLDNLKLTAAELYNHDPRSVIDDPALATKIVGGEACMWGEMANERNIMTRVWPRASAVAEVLWSAYRDSGGEAALSRLEEHACRMMRRGIDTEPPAGPGFCLLTPTAL